MLNKIKSFFQKPDFPSDVPPNSVPQPMLSDSPQLVQQPQAGTINQPQPMPGFEPEPMQQPDPQPIPAEFEPEPMQQPDPQPIPPVTPFFDNLPEQPQPVQQPVQPQPVQQPVQHPQPTTINIIPGVYPQQPVQQPKLKHSMKHLPNSYRKIPQDHIHKRIAALEVLRHLRTSKTSNIIGIIMSFVILLANLFAPSLGYGAVLITCAILGYFLFKVIREMQRLEYIYRINPKLR